jgi:hypothetical protein
MKITKMRNLTIATVALFIVMGGIAKAQTAATQNGIPNGGPWTIGIGMNVVVDDGYRIHKIFNVHGNWNAVPFPSRFSVGRALGSGLTLEAAYTYNQILAGKTVDQGLNPKTFDYNAFDGIMKYNLHCFFDNTKFPIKPYVLLGYGYTYVFPFTNNESDGSFIFRHLSGFATADVGFGFDVCFNNIAPKCNFLQNFAIGFQTMGKFTDNSGDLIQHSITIFYTFSQSSGPGL